MNEWTDTTWFNEDDIESDNKGGSDTGGSGKTPPIIIGVNYYLLDQNNEVITDGTGDPLSVEGLLSA